MAFYDLKKKPALTTKEGEKETLYPSIVYSGTLSARKLLERASYGTGYTVGELEGALSIIMDTAARYIGEGYRVELGEFGYFAGKIKASRMVAKKTDIRAASIRFNGVNFRASKQFKMKSAGELERVPERAFRTSSQLNIEELERRMMMHLEQNGFITRSIYTNLTGRLNIIRKTKCSPLFKRSDISYKTKRPPKNNFPKYSRGSKKSTGKFCFSQCFFL